MSANDLLKKLSMLRGEDEVYEASPAKKLVHDIRQKSARSEKKSKEFNDRVPRVTESTLNKFLEGDYYRDDEDTMDELERLTDKIMSSEDIQLAEGFDNYINSSIFVFDENNELRSELIGMGRKYARETAANAEVSEINKAFSGAEKRMNRLYDELEREKERLNKDLERSRMPQRGSSKITSELVSAKISAYKTQLDIIKESNSMTAKMFDLRNKEAARQAENAEDSFINTNTLQSIFSSAKNQMVEGIGGYASLSNPDYVPDDEMNIETALAATSSTEMEYDEPEDMEDGDKFLKYENTRVDYILHVDSTGTPFKITAEDDTGMELYDYPIPDNLEMLEFEFDRNTGTAVDSYFRNYKVRG